MRIAKHETTHICGIRWIYNAPCSPSPTQLVGQVEGMLLRDGFQDNVIFAQDHEAAVPQICHMDAVAFQNGNARRT